MPDDQTPNDTPPPDQPPPSRYERAQAPQKDAAFDMYIERVHDALINQALELVDSLNKEGGEANKIRDLSLSVLALSNALIVEQGD